MAWCQTGNKPLFELTMSKITDAYVSLGLNELSNREEHI